MQALSKAESLVSLIASASLDAKQGLVQLGQVQANATMLLSRPNLPTDKADELAQNISMLSLTEQDIENILNDTHVYENATRALSEAMEALGIATTARFECILCPSICTNQYFLVPIESTFLVSIYICAMFY